MSRLLALAAGLTVLTATVRADDSIAPETLDAVKKATVFVRIEGDGWSASGSGFVVHADPTAVLIATNQHVVSVPPSVGAAPGAKPSRIRVVFDAGLPTERSYAAAVAASDAERDLAVLRVAGVKDAPPPIAYTQPPKLTETTAVYSFGFPFGKALSTAKGSPAVTVGKASISSLRNGPDGELAVVQIDGNLNPGNSGGPVVDGKGRLVGVAVATIRDGPGIGLVIPAAELVRTMQGRPGKLRLTAKKAGDALAVHVETDVIDPTNVVRGATLNFVVVAPKGKKPTADALDKCPGCTTIESKIEHGIAKADFPAPASGEVLVQIRLARDGASPISTTVKSFSLDPPADYTGAPPAGWKEYSPRDHTFVMWVPERPQRQGDSEKTSILNGQRLRINTMTGRTTHSLSYQAESIVLPTTFIPVPRKDLYELFRGAIVSEVKGRLTEAKDAQTGTLKGYEYLIEAGANTTRVRMYITGARVFVVLVMGPADQVTTAEAETILSSFRLPKAPVAAAPTETPGETTPPTVPQRPTAPAKTARQGKDPTIFGGAFDPQFKDQAPEDGLLVGFAIGLGKFINTDMIRAVQPIYRVNGQDLAGKQYGTQVSNSVTIKAKEGYAVGAVTVKHGLMFDGMSVTFMKVTDGKLDPSDAYESQWVGDDGKKRPTKLGGDGTPVIGIVGKSSPKDMTGMGLLFKGQEGFEPKK